MACWLLVSAQVNASVCGDEGVWVQILGAGAGELDNDQSAPSYLVWLDDQARLLINTASGSAAQFAKAGANFADLDAIVFNDLSPQRTVDLAHFISASAGSGRDRPLPLLGPTGNDRFPDTRTLLERLIGPNGVYPQLASFLTYKSEGGYKVNARDVPSTGQRRWARFGGPNFRLSSIPVNFTGTPAIAWRVEINDQSLVFTGSFNNAKDVISKFARNTDALIMPHAVPEGVRGSLRDQYVSPTKIGEIASRAEARMVILGHRNNRTRGRETQSTEAIREAFAGPLIFANDLECWGL